MFRFSIREIMLLTLVVAAVAGWWVDRRALAGKIWQLEAKLVPLDKYYREGEAANAFYDVQYEERKRRFFGPYQEAMLRELDKMTPDSSAPGQGHEP